MYGTCCWSAQFISAALLATHHQPIGSAQQSAGARSPLGLEGVVPKKSTGRQQGDTLRLSVEIFFFLKGMCRDGRHLHELFTTWTFKLIYSDCPN